jgi:cytochrome c oxidase subunit 2
VIQDIGDGAKSRSRSGSLRMARDGEFHRMRQFGCVAWCASVRAGLLVMAASLLPLTAAAGTGQPSDRQIGMQSPVTPVAEAIYAFHDLVTIIITLIALFVLGLLIWVIVRYNERANPKPATFSHNTTIEVVWTVVPILILLVIAIPSFRLLYLQYSYPKPDLTIKAIGNAWFWDHEYPDQGIKVTSNMLRDEDVLKAELGAGEYNARFGKLEDGIAKSRILYDAAQPIWAKRGEPRQLAVDNEIAVPVNKVVHVLVTANDVIHAWTIPSFGSKTQAVPGRVNSTWFKATKTGAYYGQCSVLCGKDHSSMPIAVRVVSDKAFEDWVAAVKARDLRRARSILRAATEDSALPKLADAKTN